MHQAHLGYISLFVKNLRIVQKSKSILKTAGSYFYPVSCKGSETGGFPAQPMKARAAPLHLTLYQGPAAFRAPPPLSELVPPPPPLIELVLPLPPQFELVPPPSLQANASETTTGSRVMPEILFDACMRATDVLKGA